MIASDIVIAFSTDVLSIGSSNVMVITVEMKILMPVGELEIIVKIQNNLKSWEMSN